MMSSNRLRNLFGTLTILIVGLVCFNCDTEQNLEPQVAFIKFYGGEGDQEAVDIHVNEDGTIILLGTSIHNGNSTIFLVKTDYKGNILKTASFGNGTDVARDLEPTLDGNFVVLARTRVLNVDSVKLLKISSDLVKLDSVMDGFPGKDAFPNTVTAIDQAGIRSFIVTGSTSYFKAPSNAIRTAMHLRFSENMDIYTEEWERLRHNSTGNAGISDVAVRTVALDNNRFYVFGYSNGFTAQNFDVWYYPLNDVGLPSGNNAIASTSIDIFSDASISSDLAFGSISTAESSGNRDLVFSRFPIYTRIENNQVPVKDLGNPINTKLSISTTRNFEATKIVSKKSNDGYFVVANEIELDDSRNIWISSVDEAGNVLWSSSFGAKENDDRAGGVAELPNGRIMVLGTMHLENQDKLALINLSSMGRLTN